jgi:hypothetical protein
MILGRQRCHRHASQLAPRNYMPIRTRHGSGGERILSLACRRDRILRAREGDEGPFALRIHLDTAVSRERLAQQARVFLERAPYRSPSSQAPASAAELP